MAQELAGSFNAVGTSLIFVAVVQQLGYWFQVWSAKLIQSRGKPEVIEKVERMHLDSQERGPRSLLEYWRWQNYLGYEGRRCRRIRIVSTVTFLILGVILIVIANVID